FLGELGHAKTVAEPRFRITVWLPALVSGTAAPYRAVTNRNSGSRSSPGVVSNVTFSQHQQMARAGAAGCSPVRRRARRVDRQRRAAVDRCGPELLAGRPLVGGQSLRP